MMSPNELAEQFLPLTLTGSFNPLISILTISLRKLCAVFFSLQHVWLVGSRSAETKVEELDYNKRISSNTQRRLAAPKF